MTSIEIASLISELEKRIVALAPLAVAVSGGIDSLLLAYIANRKIGSRAHMYHAQSPAVPGDALGRIKKYASEGGWQLSILNSQGFTDNHYLDNPANRCYFCKTNLYQEIGRLTENKIASGTNTDDLNDYRPGLIAARELEVCHPYVDVGISKKNIRDIAEYFSLKDIAGLPASPCLSSRVETGIRIDASKLKIIDDIERSIRKIVTAGNVRLRFRKSSASIEIDKSILNKLTREKKNHLLDIAGIVLKKNGYQCAVNIEAYSMGKAFLKGVTA